MTYAIPIQSYIRQHPCGEAPSQTLDMCISIVLIGATVSLLIPGFSASYAGFKTGPVERSGDKL